MRVFTHDRFTYSLPEGHRFPLGRYRMLREAIEAVLEGRPVSTTQHPSLGCSIKWRA